MNPWAILGIAPTSDEREVLRAYAKKLRETRPEDDPEGFQRLMQARELALAWRPRQKEPEKPSETGSEAPSADASTTLRPFRAETGAERIAGSEEDSRPTGRGSPIWRAHPTPPDLDGPPLTPLANSGRIWRSPTPAGEPIPPEIAAPPDEVEALRLAWLKLSRAKDEVFWSAASWEDILRRAGKLGIGERDIVRRELSAQFAARLPRLEDDALRADILSVLGRLDEEFDLTRAPITRKRAGGPALAALEDWLNALVAARAVALRRARGAAAYRTETGLPLIPPEDQQAALARGEAIEAYESMERWGRFRLRPSWRVAWRAMLLPTSVSVNLNAPGLAGLVFGLEFVAFTLGSDLLGRLEIEGPHFIVVVRHAIAIGVCLAAFGGARLAAMCLWPRFAIAAAVRRVERADRAGVTSPLARKAILAPRFRAAWYGRLLAVVGGFQDAFALLAISAVLLSLLDPQT